MPDADRGDVSQMAETKLGEFQAFAEDRDPGGRLQEEYTRAFDMDETHSLYVGYHSVGRELQTQRTCFSNSRSGTGRYGIEVAGELTDSPTRDSKITSPCAKTRTLTNGDRRRGRSGRCWR